MTLHPPGAVVLPSACKFSLPDGIRLYEDEDCLWLFSPSVRHIEGPFPKGISVAALEAAAQQMKGMML